MSKSKVQGERPQKPAATIKVSTLIKGLLLIAAIAASYIIGNMTERVESQHNTQNIINAASSIFQDQVKALK